MTELSGGEPPMEEANTNDASHLELIAGHECARTTAQPSNKSSNEFLCFPTFGLEANCALACRPPSSLARITYSVLANYIFACALVAY